MKLNVKKSLLLMIQNSIGSYLFKNAIFETQDGESDILKDGDLSCAYYVSSILFLFDLIKSIHFTVKSTVADLETFGWKKINFTSIEQLKPGYILKWENKFGSEGNHSHIGFYLGDEKAVSNSSSKQCINIHSYDFDGKMNILYFLKNDLLDN